MGKRYLLGIDIGTSGCKMTVFDFIGQVVGSTTNSYKTYYPYIMHVEQDPLEWWQVICQQIEYLIYNYGIDTKAIAAIGIDGHSWACLPVYKDGTPLHRAMIWLDRRSEAQTHWMKDKIGEESLIYLNGNPVDPAYIVPKMLWLKQNKEDIYKSTYKFLQSNAYIVHRLTGEFTQDYSQGYGFHFFDISKGAWDEKVAERLEISLDLMAPLYHSHQVVGTVTSDAARETGLMPGTPVVAGGLDAACCALGAGVVETGQTAEQGGQSGGMSIHVDKPLIHPRLILGFHVIPDKWLLQGGTVGGGGSLKWLKEQIGSYNKSIYDDKKRSPYEIMSDEASTIPPGSEGLLFLPYMAGERSPIWNNKARGVFFGLSYDKTRAHMIRAIMEGVGYSLLHNLDTASEVNAFVKELIGVGGSSNSSVWTQIKSDITGKIIHVPYSEYATTLGGAMLAGVGIGVYRDFNEAVAQTVHVKRTHIPDNNAHRIYQGYYNLYLELYKRLEECYDTLHDLSTGITKIIS